MSRTSPTQGSRPTEDGCFLGFFLAVGVIGLVILLVVLWVVIRLTLHFT